jgi:hypothetical protein
MQTQREQGTMAGAAADEFDMTNPDFSHVFNELTLNTIRCNFSELTQEQQRKQMSPPFEAYGLYWMLVIEKYENEGGGSFDVHIYMYCLSVRIHEEWRENFVIKGDICSGDHVFSGRSGKAFNLPGKTFPALALRFNNRVLFRLRSGNLIEEEVETSAWSEADEQGLSFGGYYDGHWRGGIGVCLLKKHPSLIDGQQIEVSVKFELPAPRALIDFELRGDIVPPNNEVSMEIDDDGSGGDGDNQTIHQWDTIVHDAENDSDDDSFDIDDIPTDDVPTDDDDELEYDIENDEDVDDLQMKQRGYKTEALIRTLGQDSKDLLIWRGGEFSDWRIKVVSETEEGIETATTYKVHQVILATGPKKSEYFEVLFNGSFNENSDRMNTVTLAAEVASQFPHFLDYMYSQPHERDVIITSVNWRSMKYLADYFCVPLLSEDVLKFIEDNMYNLDYMVNYLSEFHDINDVSSKRIIRKATYVCAEMIKSIEIGSPLLQTISPAMFLQIISLLGRSKCFDTASNDDRNHVSRLILGYIEQIDDQSYVFALSGVMGLALFPGDDAIILSGELALDWLIFMGRRGWKDEWIRFVCISLLRRYLFAAPSRENLVTRVVNEVPGDILAILFRGALTERRWTKPKKIAGLRFKVSVMHHNDATSWAYGGHNAIRTLPPVDPTNTIPHLKMSIANSLGLRSSSFMMSLNHDGFEMNDEEAISFYKVKDNDLIYVHIFGTHISHYHIWCDEESDAEG